MYDPWRGIKLFCMRSMAKMVAYLSRERDITDLLGFAEFVEDVELGGHYIFRDGSRYLLNAPPTDGNSNPLVNISIDTLARLRQMEAEHEQLVFLVKQNWGDEMIILAQELAE